MKTIIAATDFSDNSMNAALYAADLAQVLGTTLTLCHVCEPPVVISEVPVPGASIEDVLSSAANQMKLVKEKILLENGDRLQVFTEIIEGSVVKQINEYAASKKPYAIVMGPEKETALDRLLSGGVTFSALTHLQWPLIIVPAGARFEIIRKVAIACDLENVEETIPLQELKDIVHHFSAALHVLHVGNISGAGVIETSYLRDILVDLHPVYHFLEGDNIEKTIAAFLEAESIDFLFVIPKKHSLLSRLFHPSHSKKLVLQAHIPIMTIRE